MRNASTKRHPGVPSAKVFSATGRACGTACFPRYAAVRSKRTAVREVNPRRMLTESLGVLAWLPPIGFAIPIRRRLPLTDLDRIPLCVSLLPDSAKRFSCIT